MPRTQQSQVRKRHARKGFSLQEEAPPVAQPEEEPMDYEEEDDLSDLLEDEEEPMAEDEGGAMFAELDRMYKALDDRDAMTVELAKAVRTLAKRVLSLEAEDEDEEETPPKEEKALERKEAPEADIGIGGTQDLGEDVQAGGEPQEPGLTPGRPQGIAQKGAIKAADVLEAAGVDPNVIAKATGLIRKDDKWANFGEKDADIPANAPVTPDTKDWDEDFEIVPGSGQAPDNVKGIGSVHKALLKLGVDAAVVDKLFEGAGIIRKAQAPTVGAGATGEPLSAEKLEDDARALSFRDIGQMATDMGVQYWQ